MALKLNKVQYVMLSVTDVEKTLSFYTDRLGLEAGYHDSNWAEIKTEGFVLALHSTEKPATDQTGAPVLIFATDDIVADRKALLAMDVQVGPLHPVAEGPNDTVGITCDFKDPNGQDLSLFANLKRTDWEAIKNA